MPRIKRDKKSGYEVFREILFPYLLAPDLDYVMMAFTFSRYGHLTQMRANGEKYFSHPKAVALILFTVCGIRDKWVLAAALLHDIIEDTHLLNDVTIVRNFGRRVASWVKQLTKVAGDDQYLERLKVCTEWQVLIIKLADRLHNLQTLDSFAPARRRRYLKETREHYFAIADQLIFLLPKKRKWQGERLRDAIAEICAQYK